LGGDKLILLDTHIWVWWVNKSGDLKPQQLEILNKAIDSGLFISVISVWEVAKLVEYNRLKLSISIDDWLDKALKYPGINKVELSNEIIIQSTRLKGDFHKDPADQIIVATSNIIGVPLLTADDKILSYPYIKLAH
jgi:PIN domain nuclease of toxin-antitoxin system